MIRGFNRKKILSLFKNVIYTCIIQAFILPSPVFSTSFDSQEVLTSTTLSPNIQISDIAIRSLISFTIEQNVGNPHLALPVSEKIRTFRDYIISSLGRQPEDFYELELFAMWALYLSEIDRAFADVSDFKQTYYAFYSEYAKQMTEGKIKPKSVRAYVPIIRKPFDDIKEVKDIINVDTEWSIDVLPEPENWKGPSLYSFILSVVRGQLQMSFFDHNGLIREFRNDQEIETALRTIGVIGNQGLVVLVRSSFTEQLKGFAVNGIGGRISLSGHSHPKESSVTPSQSKSLGNPADVELCYLRLMGLPEGYPVNSDIPVLAVRAQETPKQTTDQAKVSDQVPGQLSVNLSDSLGLAVERIESFAGQEYSLPINELALYLKVLKAMHGETVGTFEGSSADHEYVHSYKAEFAGELAHHPAFHGESAKMLQESLEGAFRVLGEQIAPGFMEEPGSLSRMISVVRQLISEMSSHPEFQDQAIAIINDPRTYGLGDVVLKNKDNESFFQPKGKKKSQSSAPEVKSFRGILEFLKRKIIGDKFSEQETEIIQTTDIVFLDESQEAHEVVVKAREFAVISEGLFEAVGKGNSELREDLRPSLKEVVRERADRLLILADCSANYDPVVAEVALQEYARLLEKFGNKIDFYVSVNLDRHENIMNSRRLRSLLLEVVKSVPDKEDRNNMMAKITMQLIKENDIQGALDLLEEIDNATFYVYSVSLEKMADLLFVSANRNTQMIQQLERIIENLSIEGRRNIERKIGLLIVLGDKYYDLGVKVKANAHYKEAWELSARLEESAVIRLEHFVPLMREKGLKFSMSRVDIIKEARHLGELDITNDRLSGRPDKLIAVAREHAFNKDYEKTEEVAQFINNNMDYPRDYYDHCYGAIIEAAALYGDNERIGPAANKMTHYVKDHFERAAQLLVDQGEYVKAMELSDLAMRQGYMGSSSVGYWGSTQVRIAGNVLKKDSTQIEMVRQALEKAIMRGGIGEHDLERVIDMIMEYPSLDPDGRFTFEMLKAGFERNQSIIEHKGHRVILKKLREIIMAKVQDANPSLKTVSDVYREVDETFLLLPVVKIYQDNDFVVETAI